MDITQLTLSDPAAWGVISVTLGLVFTYLGRDHLTVVGIVAWPFIWPLFVATLLVTKLVTAFIILLRTVFSALEWVLFKQSGGGNG